MTRSVLTSKDRILCFLSSVHFETRTVFIYLHVVKVMAGQVAEITSYKATFFNMLFIVVFYEGITVLNYLIECVIAEVSNDMY